MKNRFNQIKKRILEEEFSHLNPMQREACFTATGPVLILAGAGSGKTTTLISRIHYLIKYGDSYYTNMECPPFLDESDLERLERKPAELLTKEEAGLFSYRCVSPRNILAITFTNKAANELKERLEKKLGEDATGIWALTFHSACVRILREHIALLGGGLNRYFTIFDANDAKTCIKECIKELNISEDVLNHKLGYSVISKAKNDAIDAEEFRRQAGADYKQTLLAKVYTLYMEKLQKYNALDFDDILFDTVKLFEQFPGVLAEYQQRFTHIMIDEYQDTNKIQYLLASYLASKSKNLCVVGDDDQSIYKFRGADITNILNFEQQFSNTKIIKLEENYRSTKNILEAANGVIKNNRQRKAKKLWTQKEGGSKITVLNPENNYQEAEQVGRLIDTLCQDGYNYRDMAVLYRMNSLSRTFEQTFLQTAIPHRIVGGTRFFDRKEIKDIVAYLRLVLNENDDAALMRIINEPARGIGKTSVEKVQALATANGLSMLAVCEKAGEYPELSHPKLKLINFAKMIADFRENTESTEALVTSVLYGSGYMEALQKEDTEESDARIQNMKELLSMIKEDEANQDLSSFLENVSLLSDIDNYDADEDAVTLMTLHSSKGLEFPVVFLVGFEEGIFPSMQSKTEVGGLEEERRLCYVGITRAKEKLYLSYTQERMLFGSYMHSMPSQFLKEIPVETLELPKKKQVSAGGFGESYGYTNQVAQSAIGGYRGDSYNTNAIHLTPPAKKTEPKTSVNLPDYQEGCRVRHKKFGDGTVLSVQSLGNDIKLEIQFDEFGKKNVMAAFAPPQII
ncbi:MAG: UvrD-helicase domain-containing protein [Clostridia bacterium]|nr:UvrD-helicase domain-containing protein [Clostridia bacterium]